MSVRPRLALLIPAYNAAAFLDRLFESVAKQSEPFDEIWIYDDCSKDETAAIAERLGARVIRGKVNRGCSHGKSVLARQTTCEWIHFHDADDLLVSNFVAKARTWMSLPDVDIVAFGCEERWEESRELISTAIPDDAALSADPVGYTIGYKINAISGLYRRDAFFSAGGFDLDPDVLYNEDQAFHAQMARFGLRFRGESAICVINLRRHSSMWTANLDKVSRARYHVLWKTWSASGQDRHKRPIARELWLAAASAASQLDWKTADRAGILALELGGLQTIPSGALFKNLCRISPQLALRLREWLIRGLKPRLREGYPGWRASFAIF